MKMTREGLDLIKRYEGFRSKAYRDAVGVWTIGYGHTSMAGAPQVAPTMRITRAEAEAILARDVAHFANAIRPLIKTPLNDAQFSAMVSFAYNVGIGNFRRSSVLRAINRGDMDAVPRRLSLWIKAGGRTLRGLVRRRSSEAEMFAINPNIERNQRPVDCRAIPDQPQGKPPFYSTTNLAALMATIAGVIGTLQDSLNQFSGLFGEGVLIPVLLALLVACLVWIVRERHLKSRDEGV